MHIPYVPCIPSSSWIDPSLSSTSPLSSDTPQTHPTTRTLHPHPTHNPHFCTLCPPHNPTIPHSILPLPPPLSPIICSHTIPILRHSLIPTHFKSRFNPTINIISICIQLHLLILIRNIRNINILILLLFTIHCLSRNIYITLYLPTLSNSKFIPLNMINRTSIIISTQLPQLQCPQPHLQSHLLYHSIHHLHNIIPFNHFIPLTNNIPLSFTNTLVFIIYHIIHIFLLHYHKMITVSCLLNKPHSHNLILLPSRLCYIPTITMISSLNHNNMHRYNNNLLLTNSS